MKIRKIVFALFTLFFYTYCQSQSSQFETRDTVFVSSEGIKVSAEIGTLQVLENRQNKNSRLISVKFVRLKSTSNNPSYPLIYLEGGDDPCTLQASDPSSLSKWLPYLAVSDVILYDKRGTNDKSLLWVWDGSYPKDFLVTKEKAGEHWKTMGIRSLKAFQERGIDVSGYNIVENARDIEALRIALGIDRYSILAFSNGTTLGLALIKLYEDRIVSAVLAGADGLNQAFNYPSQLDSCFENLAKLATKDTEIKKLIPDFENLLQRVMSKLDKNPVEVEVYSPLTHQPMQVKVGSFGLSLILMLDIDDTSDIPVIPRLLYSIDQGDTSILKWFVQRRIVIAFAIPGNGLTQGIALGASMDRWNRIEKESKQSIFKNVVNFPFYELKDIWPKIELGVDLNTAVKSNVRTLFISGELDCRTTPLQTEEIQRGFKNSVHLIVKNAGHEQTLTNYEIKKIIAHFLSGEDIKKIEVSDKPLKFIPLIGNSHDVFHPAMK